MRWIQLTLAEDDPAHYDPGFWLDYFNRTSHEGVCLSGGGCVAYYPTEIPFHHRSAWLGDRDVLGELIDGLPRDGHDGAVRTDPHATYDDVRRRTRIGLRLMLRESRDGTGHRRRCGSHAPMARTTSSS